MTPKRIAKANRKGIGKMELRFQRTNDAITASPTDILPDPLHGLPYPQSPKVENARMEMQTAGQVTAVPDARAAYCLYTIFFSALIVRMCDQNRTVRRNIPRYKSMLVI